MLLELSQTRIVTRIKEKFLPKKVELPEAGKKTCVAMQILDTNRTNLFPQNLSFETEVVCRVGNFRFITHPVKKNPDGTHTYMIERRGSEIPTVIEITKDPDYPQDRAFYKIECYRGESGVEGQWAHVPGENAESYAKEFLASMKTPEETPQQIY